MANNRPNEGAEGFTVLEALVAFAILALSLIATNVAYGLAISSLRRTAELRQAPQVAAEVLATIEGAPVQSSAGTLYGKRWQSRTTSLPHAAGIQRIEIDVYAEGGRPLGHYLTFSALRQN